MKKALKVACRFLKDESGIGTVEIILILVDIYTYQICVFNVYSLFCVSYVKIIIKNKK